ncbi:enoyl-CoA hydratase/isomerase family protein [Sphingobium sp. DEHP117]|uniref:enoyl-CoA hydratase/isomerase family protein n=1 Tax=Sphingobium sp. DEHP117 TaxID=2993436 RepID=UPI0027D614EC|nr:enoyl-CoA hydratase-related protein [Sphingobium sp. DEHP117]MDQ4420331.1 enoyl-CoA hydratase/isomerase family protein [Sphingobium sp. DEHP117]
MDHAVPEFETIALKRRDRVLTITLNRPDVMNAFDKMMHDELPEALVFARDDRASDVLVLTGSGKAFSAGGDLAHIADNAAHPEKFDHEIAMARRIVMTLLETEKPVICQLNGHAVGLGATIALLCDIVYAAERAKIGDPHVAIGLAAGDGGALVWPARVGLTRAKEFLLTGELLTAGEAASIGLINRTFAAEDLDAAVEALSAKLLSMPQIALRKTKALLNLETLRAADGILDVGLEWEKETVRSAEHRSAIEALLAKA